MAIVTAHVNAVQQLYVAYFNRPADYAGLDYWTNVVAAQKGSTAAVSAAFAAEAEYKTAYANMTNAQVVNQVYQNLFGRPAEAAGQNYWADLLDRKVITIDKVVAEISKGAQTTDKTAYENKVAGATAFSAALDTKAEQDGYRGAEANKLAKAFITSITTDASLTVATAPATLNATVAKVVIAGTPFTLQSGLQALQAANEAKTAFLDAADGKVDQKLVTEASITDKVTTTTAAIDTYIAGYSATSSAAVKAALLADKVAANTSTLAAAQMKVAEDQVAIAKVAGLTNAIAADAAAEAALTAAQNALKLATADQAAKEAAFESLNGGTNITINANGTVAGLIKLDSAGKLVLDSSAVTETAKPGVTALLAAVTANQAAIKALDAAVKAEAATTATVNYLDVTAGSAEAIALADVKAAMTNVTVATGSMPTLEQIAAEQQILDAKAAADATVKPAADAFKLKVDAYKAVYADNKLVSTLAADQKTVTDTAKSIEDFTKAVADMNKAIDVAAQLTAVNAAITGAQQAFVDNGMLAPVTLDATMKIATDGNDIYQVGTANAQSIALFGLQGTDSLFIGSKYTLNTTAKYDAATGKITGGNDGALEAFIFQDGVNTKVVLEKSVFGSSAAAPEVITITLTGVTSTEVTLSNGIITG
ncbi:hypothetical protein MasN3_43790 [Massilia varians]|uniref:DUF4214 domain-containing protein n=1 Tax=Massilia varians TaxID=457921 RepID=A0ABN6TIM9_9BURK|nr:DUF4214 domain-containing protein [Massilia varians]BDT60885.1 hypothetical protein MasN3_43790 [Massilia varians]